MSESEDIKKHIKEFPSKYIKAVLIIFVLLAIAVNLGCLYGIYKCFQAGNYPLGIVLTIAYLVLSLTGNNVNVRKY